MRKSVLIFWSLFFLSEGFAQSSNELIQQVKQKLEKVNDYTAIGKLRTTVVFIKAPISNIKVFFKKPDQFKIKKNGGISILPKGGIKVNLKSILNQKDFVIVESGNAMIQKTNTKILKLIPTTESSDVVLTTLYIDEVNKLVLKANTTTKENGTYEMEMFYRNYANYALPDKVIFSFNTKDYKLPKGFTMEFDSGEKATEKDIMKNKKGKVEILYSSYSINKGIADAEFL